MAEIPLRIVSWVYDEDTNRVEARFEDVPLPDDPDPVNFQSTKFFTVEILPQSVDSEVRVTETPAPGGS